jgi:hypothetical protein
MVTPWPIVAVVVEPLIVNVAVACVRAVTAS